MHRLFFVLIYSKHLKIISKISFLSFKNFQSYLFHKTRLRFERDNIVNYTHEVERLEKVCAEESQEIDNLEHVLKIIERYEMRVPLISCKYLFFHLFKKIIPHQIHETYVYKNFFDNISFSDNFFVYLCVFLFIFLKTFHQFIQCGFCFTLQIHSIIQYFLHI